MKKYNLKNKALTLFSLVLVLLLSSCEDIVTLDLETGEPKVVVDAEILWEKGTSGNVQVIKISKMAPYYSTTTPKVSGANVRVENSNGDIFTFTELESGSYTCNDFVPVLNMSYTLYVETEGKSFSATEKLTSVAPIKRIQKNYIPNSTGPDVPELAIYYDDPTDEVNYYLTDFKTDFYHFPYFVITRDELVNGNEISDRFSDKDLKPGKKIEIRHRGISKNFFNYMNLVLEASGWNPFAANPGNIRGNVVSTNDPKDFALGYFRLCEANYILYEIE